MEFETGLTKRKPQPKTNRQQQHTTKLLRIMLSTRSTGSLHDPNLAAVIDLEQQIALIDAQIAPLRKTAKKLAKLDDELERANLLIDSGVGSKADKASLRKTKKELRQRRVQLWQQLEALPALLEERQDLLHQLEILRRQHGIL